MRFNKLSREAMREKKNERKRNDLTDILRDLALLLGLKDEARIFSEERRILEEVDRKKRRERSRSQRELDKAK